MPRSIQYSKILSPHRGNASSMASDKKTIVLAAGELFIEYPNAGVGKSGVYKIKIGDGTTQYQNLPYAFTSDTTITFSDDTSSDIDTALGKIVSGAEISTIVAASKRAIVLTDHYYTTIIPKNTVGSGRLVGVIDSSNGKYGILQANTTIDILYPILYTEQSCVGGMELRKDKIKMVGNVDVSATTTFSTKGLILFAKGMLNGTLFTINSFTTTRPTSSDGYEYLMLGVTSGTNTLALSPNHDIYKYTNGVFARYSDTGDYGSEDPLSN